MSATTMGDSIDELLARARAGDRDAFDALIALHVDRLAALIRSRTGRRASAHVDADDILQETLASAFRSLDRFEPRGADSLLRWLGGIAEHRIRDALRRHEARPAVPLDVDVDAGLPTPSRAARRDERFDRFEAALGELPPDYRRAVILARIEGLTVEEVARRMDRSPNAVSHLLLRALRRLRESLGDTESLSLPDRRLTGGTGEDRDRGEGDGDGD